MHCSTLFPRFTAFALAIASLTTSGLAHEGHEHSGGVTNATPMPFITETKGPIRAPKAIRLAPSTPVSGSGFWRFVAARNLVPVPPEAQPKLKGAHGSLVVDAPRDTVYFGLQDVGFIAFSNKLTQSWIVKGDPALAKGNIHGADLLQRRGKPPLIVAADNNDGLVHLTDGTFQHVQNLPIPGVEQYADKKGFAPTDAAFQSQDRVWVTDGYGKAYFLPADTDPAKYTGKVYGGKSMSGTPHGITYDHSSRTLLISARPEGRILQWDVKRELFVAMDALPPGSTVCDVNVWGDYLLAPCLDDPDKTKAGPIYIVNLKKRAVVATLRPKDDLGYGDAQHIHGACWYVTGKGSQREVYVVFTNWNPGGIGALRLVNPLD